MRNKYSFLDVKSIDNPLNIWNQIIEKSLMISWLHNYSYINFQFLLKKIHTARIKRKQNALRNEIKLNKLEYKLTSQKLYSNQL